MFPSNPNSSNDHVFPPLDSFSNHENYDVHFNYLQMNYNNNTPEVPSSQIMHNIVTTINQDFVMQQQKFSERSGLRYCEDGSHDDLLDSVISSDTKETATAKKDGSCRKINTARGPRDRRVRFSTEIARKFFGLQDLLGFDRASKTLDWLLTSSVTAIKELVEETKHDSSDRSNLKFLETIVGGSDEKKSVVKCVDGKKTKSRRKCEGGSFRANNAARDRLRAEARARARERTREKMRVKKVDDELVLDSKLTLKKSGGFWSEIEVESDCKNLGCECIMDQETMLKESEDSSYLYASLYENLEQYFMNIR